ncbi:hypothetical protein HYALB_00005610 [Hymenoscyphus albidus]|uniref:Alpha/beta hydrolase fold-3 domain-containing protein n=1 Tax=Hymenoscyphus albidus TaxID=595503 RepID=A0A9N9Q5K6_9HELO|nr:hypothetical protein HYALB_00005610 [Hymenoscyphus albidus]
MSNSTEGYDPRWLQFEEKFGARPLFQGSPEDILTQFKGLVSLITSQSPPPDPSVITDDTTANGVPVRIYKPAHAIETGSTLPIGVYFHGGGWMVGDLDSEDPWCRYITTSTPCIIVSVDYRLTPEYQMPTQLEDCLAAFHWVYNNAEDIGGCKEKIFTIGASAGGALALLVADQLIKSKLKSYICGIIAIVPVTTHPSSPPAKLKSHYNSYISNSSGVPVIDAAVMETFFQAANAQPNDEKCFVTLSKDLGDFPPVYIATCGKDPLRDDGVVLEMMLGENGVKVVRDHYEGFPHYFWFFPGVEGKEIVLDNVAKGIRALLGY